MNKGEPLVVEFDWTQGLLREGLRQYNTGQFFAAHESWESVWLGAQEPDKTFLQGLIQVTAAFHHSRRNNSLGTAGLLRAALRKLEQYPDGFAELSVALLCEEIRDRLQALEANTPVAQLTPTRILPR